MKNYYDKLLQINLRIFCDNLCINFSVYNLAVIFKFENFNREIVAFVSLM